MSLINNQERINMTEPSLGSRPPSSDGKRQSKAEKEFTSEQTEFSHDSPKNPRFAGRYTRHSPIARLLSIA
jgi:hypothetical protein